MMFVLKINQVAIADRALRMLRECCVHYCTLLPSSAGHAVFQVEKTLFMILQIMLFDMFS
jgi:hypothetical protein